MTNDNQEKEITSLEDHAGKTGINLIQDRYHAQQPQCGFGIIGVCCRICNAGPCRIDPITNLPEKGICGAGIPLIVTRNWLRRVTAGAASKVFLVKSALEALKTAITDGSNMPPLKEEAIVNLSQQLGLFNQKNKGTSNIGREKIYQTALSDLETIKNKPPTWLTTHTPPYLQSNWEHLGILPTQGQYEIIEGIKRSSFGVNADPFGNVRATLKIGILAGYIGSKMTNDLVDLFQIPNKTSNQGALGFGVLSPTHVNILLLPGVDPLLIRALEKAKTNVTPPQNTNGFSFVGVGSSGLELLRTNIGNAVGETTTQEHAFTSGLVDLAIRGIKDGYQSTTALAQTHDVKIVTTHDIAKVKDSKHTPVSYEHLNTIATTILEEASRSYEKRRSKRRKQGQWGKSTPLQLFSMNNLRGNERETPLSRTEVITRLAHHLKEETIHGIILIYGENLTLHSRNQYVLPLAQALLKHNCLLLVVGDPILTMGKHGLMDKQARRHAGSKLKNALDLVAKGQTISANPVWAFGPQDRLTEVIEVVQAIATNLETNIHSLPIVALTPELRSDETLADCTWLLAMGIPTLVGVAPEFYGAKEIREYLTNTMVNDLGSWIMIEPDTTKAKDKLIHLIDSRRKI